MHLSHSDAFVCSTIPQFITNHSHSGKNVVSLAVILRAENTINFKYQTFWLTRHSRLYGIPMEILSVIYFTLLIHQCAHTFIDKSEQSRWMSFIFNMTLVLLNLKYEGSKNVKYILKYSRVKNISFGFCPDFTHQMTFPRHTPTRVGEGYCVPALTVVHATPGGGVTHCEDSAIRLALYACAHRCLGKQNIPRLPPSLPHWEHRWVVHVVSGSFALPPWPLAGSLGINWHIPMFKIYIRN